VTTPFRGRLDGVGVSGVGVDISCLAWDQPAVGSDQSCRKVTSRPTPAQLLLVSRPRYRRFVEVARAVPPSADALTLISTCHDANRHPFMAPASAGLNICPDQLSSIAMRMVHSRPLGHYTIISCGGISSGEAPSVMMAGPAPCGWERDLPQPRAALDIWRRSGFGGRTGSRPGEIVGQRPREEAWCWASRLGVILG
jgi:hypothetical protein